MPKPWYSIKAAATGSDTAEVSVLDTISQWYGVNAQTFLAEARTASKDAKRIKLMINSPGGDVGQAIAMFNGLRMLGKTIEVHVLGVAASAASYLAMAGDEVVMPANTMMVLHKPMNGVFGNADEHRDAADTLDMVEQVLLPAYMSKFKGTEDELRAILREDTLMTAEQCLEHGFATKVVPEIEATAGYDLDMLPEAARKVFMQAKPKPAPALTIDAVTAIAKEFGVEAYAGDLFVDDKLKTEADMRAAAAEAKDIVAVCALFGAADRAKGFVMARKPAADVKRIFAVERSEEADKSIVNTARPTDPRDNDPTAGAPKVLNAYAIWDSINKAKQTAGSKQ